MEILFYNLNKKKPFGINKIYIFFIAWGILVFWAILSSSCSFVRFDYQERIITHIGIRTPFFILFVAIFETLIYCNLIICVLNKITRNKNIILLVSCILFGLSHYDKI